jgi:hypothetical protein
VRQWTIAPRAADGEEARRAELLRCMSTHAHQREPRVAARALRLGRARHDAAQRLVQAFDLVRRQVVARTARVDARGVQRLVRVHVADAREERLVEQQRLHGCLTRRERVDEVAHR